MYTGCQWHKEEEETKKIPYLKEYVKRWICVWADVERATVLTGNRLFFAEVLFDSDWNISALRHVTPQPESLRYNESHLFALSQCLSGLCSPSANLLPHSTVFAAFYFSLSFTLYQKLCILHFKYSLEARVQTRFARYSCMRAKRQRRNSKRAREADKQSVTVA